MRGGGGEGGCGLRERGARVVGGASAVARVARREAAAHAFDEGVGSVEAELLAARQVYRLPARQDLPPDSLPPWVRDVRGQMKVADVDWDMLAQHGAEWMRYWDENVRGKSQGKR